jgi:hypothetical protein
VKGGKVAIEGMYNNFEGMKWNLTGIPRESIEIPKHECNLQALVQ